MVHILHIDSSARQETSASRLLSAELAEGLMQKFAAKRTYRDLNHGIPPLDEAWIAASFTPTFDRNAAQETTLAESRLLISELEEADHIVIGLPLYNFAIPAVLKMWIDQVARPGLTFLAKASGFIGLLEGKTAYLVITSGGTEVKGPIDFATNYLVYMLNFLGIADVRIISATKMMADPAHGLATARDQIDAILLADVVTQDDTLCSAAIF